MRCIECDLPVVNLERAHSAHEPTCHVDPACDDWSCGCDAYAHSRCCRFCRPIPGQLEAFPSASTRGLPKKAAV